MTMNQSGSDLLARADRPGQEVHDMLAESTWPVASEWKK